MFKKKKEIFKFFLKNQFNRIIFFCYLIPYIIMSISDEERALGIDLGTTYSYVPVWKKEKVDVISNKLGNRILLQ